ncbi:MULTISPECIES: phosphonate metabolism protein/1,5-bisphosphokinase (PRPP-forming) PhnN [unclassified Afipia]|jgi:ribose 1,5-bisphosphokinase|uniref:phosphonate metabolism protein/1,5-bisphosphokinase (PRPP-forming) PhnN n=1 Tax=unclassified Afipia TaxID=2642050 RepID=UPI0004066E3D|nr:MULTISPECIES: phosphonate metabolism protein/1,5-bisphosphokinase (PRPP-forming) PhnN [unclassified Afipia]MBQ8106132.1 phosphonate metabolism protein/1,5-bisphosphokinase (PRPP-forming) PhnN [Afipia sp.]MBS4002804.1 phosphonate metabolism protein/1,5-bisphosphokinase (PRPP-forming) PhnN [Afipia sp.]WIG51372.1 MAG: Ribose 1,5-bisphosphate phosphokinase PhnN [Afipia sp.]
MTDIATLSVPGTDLIGPGRLVLIVGPSGAGKDTLIGLAQAACAGDSNVVFPQRIVTREASSFENNEAVSPMRFGQMLAHGDFAFQWEAHGLRYGVPRSIVDDIRAGHAVVVNASRTIVEFARRSYANVTVVSVTAPPEILAQRLAARARSSDGQLDGRLRRAVAAPAADVVINNIGRAEDHAAELLKAIGRT